MTQHEKNNAEPNQYRAGPCAKQDECTDRKQQQEKLRAPLPWKPCVNHEPQEYDRDQIAKSVGLFNQELIGHQQDKAQLNSEQQKLANLRPVSAVCNCRHALNFSDSFLF